MACYSIGGEMFFIDANIGFIAEICQSYASIYKTVNGGQTWTDTGFNGMVGLAMYFLDENNGYYAFHPGGNNKSYFRKNSSNMFETYKYIFSNLSSKTKIKFINDSTGFIICRDTLNNAVILKTNDCGSNWSEKILLNNNFFQDIYFISDSVGFVIETNGYILKTDDCGDNWKIIDSNTSNSLISIDFANDHIGYIVGNNGEVLKTQDQGLTWDSEVFINTSNLIYVRAFNNGNVYINDINGNLYGSNIKTKPSIKIYPNPAKDVINLQLPSTAKNYNISIYNIQGKKIITTNKNIINIEDLKSGVYLIKTVTDTYTYENKIIKL